MVIGVTGAVGSGKSTVLQILKEDYQAAVIMTDDLAKDLMLPGQEAYQSVVSYFGNRILTDGAGSPIDRSVLSRIVFQEKEKLKALNEMTHPLVKDRTRDMIAAYKKEGVSVIVIETAILIQAGFLDLVDELWVVCVSQNIREKRLMQSRGYTREKIAQILKNQMSEEEMCAQADFVIDNSGTEEDTRIQIQEHLHRAGD